ncbi:unnamed protein product [Rhizoctonia solani]|uniref:Uncharacterized protein n=1 Tax=Rhizoctonia solani TaxID=456999 RepID=A0A8H3E4R4_9AGAM|nr:unnamed protein product [Rhizoctonia solani]
MDPKQYGTYFFSAVDESVHYDPIELMYEARKKDEARQRTIMTKENIKKISLPKGTVPFHIHDGSPTTAIVSHRICKESTEEEVLFKLSRGGAAIKLQENAFFYIHIHWKGENTMAVNLGLKSSRTSELCSKKKLLAFKDYFDANASLPASQGPLPVHVFLDRDPCIHILLTTKNWSRLFSLARIIENNQTIVLKGVDGTLYHAKQVMGELITPNAKIGQYWVHRRGNIGGQGSRYQVGLKAPASDCIGNLLQAREHIRQEEVRLKKESKYPSWLIEIASEALNKEPDFGKWGSNPKFASPSASGLRPTIREWRPAPSQAVSGSAGTTSHVSNSGQPEQAHSLVKKMAQKYEEDRKKNEKKDKGFFGKLFGKK